MAGFSNYLEDKILNFLRGTAMGTAPAAVYIGLFNGDMTVTGSGGTERPEPFTLPAVPPLRSTLQ